MKCLLRGLKKMIFNRLFQRAYQHPEPQKRIAAIANMDPTQEKDKQVLHELAFNDEHADVSIAALNKLNSFTLWLKAYETHFQQRVQNLAKDKVLQLMEDSSAVNDVLFNDILKQRKHTVLLKEMVFTSQRLAQHELYCVETLLSLCAENEVRRFYLERANDAQKRAIIDKVDEKSLKRFKKVDNSVDVASYLDERLHALAEAAQKPAKLISAATLINSKLLAISDLMDYESIQAQKQSLINEFDALKTQFTLLTDEESANLTSKYFNIKEKVERRLSQLEPDYMASLHLRGITDAISDIQSRAATIFQQIEMLSASDSPEQLSSQTELLERAIADLQLELSDIDTQAKEHARVKANTAHRHAIATLDKTFNEHLLILAKLPETIERNSQIDELMSQIHTVLNPEEVSEHDAEAKVINDEGLADKIKQLETLLKKGTTQARKRQFSVIQQKYTEQKKARAQAANRAEKRCFSKLNVCLNMIEQGKFKVAIATFHAAQKLVEQLDSKSTGLLRKYEDTQAKVSELKDWQSYIAAPKKPELIQAANALAENQHIDIQERASLVKQYRSEFLSLGRLHTEDDDQLNTQFDISIEKAFAPCRAHFADLDKIREQNLQKGEQILAALDALQALDSPVTLAKQLTSIAQQYRKLGDLDKHARTQLHKRYQSKLKPLQARVNAFYQNNAEAKQKLIIKAEKLMDSEDINEAVNLAKGLQLEWKSIGFAGAKQDQALWQSFREANDRVFKRLQDSISEQKQATHAQVQAITVDMDDLNNAISKAQQLGDVGPLNQQIESIQRAIQELPSAQLQVQLSKLRAYQATLDHKIKSFENHKQNSVLASVFDTLANYTEALDPERLKALPTSFKQAFEQSDDAISSQSVLSGMNRKEVALAADILLADGKGFADSKQKKDVQLKLMAAKLEGQIMPDANALLLKWISAGPLSETDQSLLKNFKKLYVDQ